MGGVSSSSMFFLEFVWFFNALISIHRLQVTGMTLRGYLYISTLSNNRKTTGARVFENGREVRIEKNKIKQTVI